MRTLSVTKKVAKIAIFLVFRYSSVLEIFLRFSLPPSRPLERSYINLCRWIRVSPPLVRVREGGRTSFLEREVNASFLQSVGVAMNEVVQGTPIQS